MEKLTRSAEISASSYNEANNTIDVIWSTGASVNRRDWRTGAHYREVLDMAPTSVRLERLNAGAPLLDAHMDHSLRNVIGAVVPGSARVNGSKGLATVKLSAAAGDADTVGKIKDGIIRNISVGYNIHKVEVAAADESGIEIRTAVDWEPMEISAVPIPADAGAQIRMSGEDGVSILARFAEGLAALPEKEVAMTDALALASAWADRTDLPAIERADRAYDDIVKATRDYQRAAATFGATLALALVSA